MNAPLSELFPIQHQPPIYAVRKLVTKLKQAEKDIGYTPHVVADLREFLPPAAPEYQRVDARRDDEKDALKSSKDRERPPCAMVLRARALDRRSRVFSNLHGGSSRGAVTASRRRSRIRCNSHKRLPMKPW